MATMFSTGERSWAIQFKPDKRTRKTITLAGMDRRAAQAIRYHVERLIESSATHQPLTLETAKWVGGIGNDLYAKLVKVGLIAPREHQGPVELAAMLDGYIASRTDLKKNTHENFSQARNSLVAHFKENRDVRTINRGEAKDWERGLRAKLAEATVATHIKKARQFFNDAIDRHLITDNPFKALKVGSQVNEDRAVYVPVPDVEKVMDACPDAEWRLIFALARYAGLRVPSETNGLFWSEIDWEERRMIVHSPKTEHHKGKAKRTVPIFPELMPRLRDAFEQAGEGAKHVIARQRGENLRTMGERIVERAGLIPWGKLFQNLRVSCETDIAAHFPIHVACKWIGNTAAVAMKHYLQVTERDFARATGRGAARGAVAHDDKCRKVTEHQSENPRKSEGFAESGYPQGESNWGRKSSDFVGILPTALHGALHRLEIASPFTYGIEVIRLTEMGVLRG